MISYYKYKGKLVDVEKHFNGACEILTNKSLVLLLNGFKGKKYIPLNKIVFEHELTEKQKLIINNPL